MPLKKNRILVVGAGFAGATIARELADSGLYQVDIIDQRPHIAGNAFDPIDSRLGLRIHQYGPHIFHTNNQGIVDFLSRFTQWLPYEHKVEALVDKIGFVPLPINRTTINKIYRQKLSNEEQVRTFLGRIRCHHSSPANAEQAMENVYGTELTQLFFGRYTQKMWDMKLSDLPAEILARLPVRYDDNRNYFSDKFQAIPEKGYLGLFKNMLDHDSISVSLSSGFELGMEKDFCHIFNSMPIDVYFKEQFGPLPYRSIRFMHEKVEQHYQPVPTINFTDESVFTRQTDWRLYPGCQVKNGSAIVLTKEVPCSYEDNSFERYYPIKTLDGAPQRLYKRYREEANKLKHVTFIGRCGQYIYYDMHQVVANSLKIAKGFLSG